ncbi:MAG: 4-phosphoerythronate dehydrogenase [Ignavibacteriae bacterium]|nr:MAG: 4-phosphoerythronate dehydrogenase [Ignavibacteriota bacterium]
MPQDVHIVVNKHTPYVVQAFENIGKVTALDTSEITTETVRDADILIVRSETKVTHELLDGSRVKFVGTVTIGTDHVDKEYLARQGITFVSAPGSNSNSVSEYITAALLELASSGNFQLQGKTIGIVGVGNVGSKVWRKAEALGMRVLLNDPPLQRQGSSYPLHPLDELMAADVITLHVPLTRKGDDATVHLFAENRIRRMKPGAILMNTSRGGVVETESIKKALLEKHLGAAVLDVWEGEPKINVPLLELVSLASPHIAGYSLDGKVNALRMNYEAVCRFLSIPADRDIQALVPAPASPQIKLPAKNLSTEQALREIVKKCYDIKLDDRQVRELSLVPEAERGRFFQKLRADYRIRREFFNSEIVLPADAKELHRVLTLLGFNVNIDGCIND